MTRRPPAPPLPRRCLCGCHKPVKPGRRYATSTCHLTPEMRRQAGHQGGKTRAAGYRLRLIAALAELSREDAILEAYARGRRAGYEARAKARAAA